MTRMRCVWHDDADAGATVGAPGQAVTDTQMIAEHPRQRIILLLPLLLRDVM